MLDYTSYIQLLVGYTVTTGDLDLLTAIENGEKQHILNYISTAEIPDKLQYVLRDLVTARFLKYKATVVLGDDNLNVAKAVTEGDVSVQIGGTTAEERLNDLISVLASRESDLVCYRQIRW